MSHNSTAIITPYPVYQIARTRLVSLLSDEWKVVGHFFYIAAVKEVTSTWHFLENSLRKNTYIEFSIIMN